MSAVSAKAFIERLRQDKGFRSRLAAAKDMAGIVAMARSEGFNCTEPETGAALAGLTPADLDHICGGEAPALGLITSAMSEAAAEAARNAEESQRKMRELGEAASSPAVTLPRK